MDTMNAGILKIEDAPVLSLAPSLIDFIQAMPCPADLKAAEPGSYLVGNIHSASLLGVPQHRYPGLSLRDWQTRCGMEASVVDAILKLERQVMESRVIAYHEEYFLASTGYVMMTYTIKKPVLGDILKDKVVAIMGYSMDVTHCVDRSQLFALYRHYYSDIQAAIQWFLRYLKIEVCFETLPTEAEVQTLLSLAKSDQASVEEKHQQALEKKLKVIGLNSLLAYIQRCSEIEYSVEKGDPAAQFAEE